MCELSKQIARVCGEVLKGNAKHAVLFHKKNDRVKATIRQFKRSYKANVYLVVSVGRPNYQERQILKRDGFRKNRVTTYGKL